jgi:hypothetical protein
MSGVIAALPTCVERTTGVLAETSTATELRDPQSPWCGRLASFSASLYRLDMRSRGVRLRLAGTCLLLAISRSAPTAEPDASHPLPVSPGREIALEGEVVDLECFLRDGSRGERHKSCALTCRKNGGSLAIVEDKTGDLYPVAGNAAASDPGAAVADFIGSRVSVRGDLYERSGARILVVEAAERLR